MSEQLPDLNLFMMCKALNQKALRDLPSGLHVRNCRKDELDIWKAMPFDDVQLAKKYYNFMTQFYNTVYAKNEDLFFQKCLFVCNNEDKPIATCFAWKVYDKIITIHWLKVLKEYEGRGIGRALLSIVMESIKYNNFPVFLHTQPESFRAVKLYSDFGFYLLSDPIIGTRKNNLKEGLQILKKELPFQDYRKLKITKSPKFFLDIVGSTDTIEF